MQIKAKMAYLTYDELLRLLQKAKDDSERNYLMIRTAFWHGFRATELISLTKDNICDGYITVQRLKKSLKTTHPLMSHANPLLDETSLPGYVAKTPGLLFPVSRQTFWNYVQKYGEQAGIPQHKRHPHALKHTCAKLGLDKGMKINEVQKYLGHKSGSSTLEYLKVDDNEASKAMALAMGV